MHVQICTDVRDECWCLPVWFVKERSEILLLYWLQEGDKKRGQTTEVCQSHKGNYSIILRAPRQAGYSQKQLGGPIPPAIPLLTGAFLCAFPHRLPDMLLPHNKCQCSARRMATNAIAAVITTVITFSFSIVITATTIQSLKWWRPLLPVFIVAWFICPFVLKDNLQAGSYVICCTTSGVTDSSSFVSNTPREYPPQGVFTYAGDRYK